MDALQEKFCTCVDDWDKDCFQQQINQFLKAQDRSVKARERLAGLRDWLAESPCVESAEILGGVIETDPPIHRFQVKFRDDAEKHLLFIWNDEGKLRYKSIR